MLTHRLLVIQLLLVALVAAKSKVSAVQEDIIEYKDFKKLLRTKNNVLALYVSNAVAAAAELKVFREAAEEIRGTGTMLYVDCANQEKKKLCKKLKVTSKPYCLRHYKDGEYHKDYDRQLSVDSMVTFMRDPAGDLPWEEDPAGADVLHFNDATAFSKHLRKNIKPMLVMFYVPWCGFCKRMKPDYSKAATELKTMSGEHLLAAMNVERQENAPIRKLFNITGFPTLIYFENGKMRFTYEGENTKDAMISFMLNPNVKPTPKPKEPDWSADTSSEIVHLTTQGFEPAINDEKSVLVMFYAPWCVHCKRMKPEYEKAALEMKQSNIAGVLAALDATKEPKIGEKYKVKGYPTVKYFSNGVYKFDVNVREASKIVEFMRNPTDPPPTPAPENSWEDEADSTNVLFLNDTSFSTLKRKKHALVMFYAPWCGHCKHTKPEFTAAANALQDDPRVVFVAVDCTKSAELCAKYNVRGYPTIIYFSYLKIQVDYNGGRTSNDFIAYINNPPSGNNHSEL